MVPSRAVPVEPQEVLVEPQVVLVVPSRAVPVEHQEVLAELVEPQGVLVVPSRAVPVEHQEVLVEPVEHQEVSVVPSRGVPAGLLVGPGVPSRAVLAVCFHHRFRHSFQFLHPNAWDGAVTLLKRV